MTRPKAVIQNTSPNVQAAVKELLALGQLPASDEASVEGLKRFEVALEGVARPIAQAEAEQLAKLFGPDDCFGLAWSLLHLIETVSNLRPVLEQADETNMWISSMRERLDRTS